MWLNPSSTVRSTMMMTYLRTFLDDPRYVDVHDVIELLSVHFTGGFLGMGSVGHSSVVDQHIQSKA